MVSLFLTCKSYSTMPKLDEWEKVVTHTVPKGREQLINYKEIYDKHREKCKDSEDLFNIPVEGLEKPLFNSFVNAYYRLKSLETEDTTVEQRIGMLPTNALKALFEMHTKKYKFVLPSITVFYNCVMNVVDLLDLCFCFTPSDQNVGKDSGETLFNNRNNSSINLFFSPVFLTRTGLNVNSLNFAYFGKGPLLAIVEVGPKRDAHNQYFKNSHREFIQNHDLLHTNDLLLYLGSVSVNSVKLIELLRAFYSRIVAAYKEDSLEHNYL
jgi:hypothetical protein